MEFREVERSIEFLLAQQARFVTDLQQSRELSDQRHAEMSRAMIGVSATIGLLAESDLQLTRRMEELAVVQKELASAHKDLMQTVERHLREQHGGDAPS